MCVFLSLWRQTCVTSSSLRATWNRTPNGNGSSTLGTERTSSSPSFTEPSWSDVHFHVFLHWLSTTSSSSAHHREMQLQVLVLWSGFCFLATADMNGQPPPSFFFHSLSGYIFKIYGWDLKWLLCALNDILRTQFPITLCGLCFLPPLHFLFFIFLFFILRKKPSMSY